MTKSISIIATALAIIACVAAWQMHVQHKRAMQAALKQQEAELTQSYLGLIDRIMNHTPDSPSKLDVRTVEQALDRLADMLKASKRGNTAELRPHVAPTGNAAPSSVDSPPAPERAASDALIAANRGGVVNDEEPVPTNAEAAQIVVTDPDDVEKRQFGSRFEIPQGVIAFVADDGDGEIYTINSDGSNRSRLTRNEVNDLYPTWMNDGKHIAFVSEESGGRELYVMNAISRQAKHVPTEFEWHMPPAWTADRKKIAWVEANDGKWNIHISSLSALSEPVIIADAHSPSWSPDGKQLAFERERRIFIVNADGTSEKPLLPENSIERAIQRMPRWSPDGKSVMYTGLHVYPGKRAEHFESGIFVVEMKLQQRHQITAGSELGLEWSPDSSHIVFFHQSRQGRGELFIVPAAGGDPFPLTTASVHSPWASWRDVVE